MASDRWLMGDSYEAFMGRWSRQIAPHFLDWLALATGLSWLDVGCGTGALSQAICIGFQPSSIVGCDPSAAFVSFAQEAVSDCSATFVVADSDNLPSYEGGFDAIVSGLVLNFLPQPLKAVQSMRASLRPGGTLAAYVWDYAQGMEFLRIFWEEASALDPSARQLDEAGRFPICHPDRLVDLFTRAGMEGTATVSLQVDTIFQDFQDFWSPFLAGTGPAPSYVASLAAQAQGRLAARLRTRLISSPGAKLHLTARAFAIRGVRPPEGTTQWAA
jgi:SAM-dependent methyltransferase